MNGFDPGLLPAVARLDFGGRLLDAEPRILDLNRRAGGAVGEPLAVPALATLARLSYRLGIPITRSIVAADGEDDVDLWVRAEPDAHGIRIEASGWRARSAWQREEGDGRSGDADFLHAGADWLWEADAALHLTYVSDGAGAAYGFDPASVLGAPLTRLFVLADDGDGSFPILGAVAAQAQFDGQHARIRGTDHRVRLSAAPRTDPAGRFAGFSGAAHAVEAENAIPEAGDRLSDTFGRRLGRALRSPLGRIIANADSIAARAEGPLQQDYADYAADIANAGRHLMGLVDDLEDLQAIERDDFTVAVEPVDLADLARRAAGLLSVRATGGQVSIDRPAADIGIAAQGEFRRVLQILVNLIGNAVRYSPPGAAVWVRVERAGDTATVVIADQGKGIAPEDHDRIFDKFERVDPAEAGGSGLGLYIARRLARAMGGDITVDSAPGHGARFTLSLPAR